MTIRISLRSARSGVGRQLYFDNRGASGRAADSQLAIHGLDPLGEPGQAAAALDAGASGTIVADLHPQQRGPVHHFQLCMPGAAVLGDVGKQFRRAEVGDGLDRGRRALGQVDDQLDRRVAARGEGGERGAEAAVKYRRVDAAGQVAQLG
jgi:hypothetical protein